MPSSRELFILAYEADKQKRYTEAEKLYRDCLNIDPIYSMAWNNLGWILYDQQQKYDEALECYEKAIKYDDHNFFAWNNLGIYYYRRIKDYKKAEKCWKKAVKIYPEFEKSWNNLGVLYKFQMTNPQKSRDCFEKAELFTKKNLKKSSTSLRTCKGCGHPLEEDQEICEICGLENKTRKIS